MSDCEASQMDEYMSQPENTPKRISVSERDELVGNQNKDLFVTDENISTEELIEKTQKEITNYDMVYMDTGKKLIDRLTEYKDLVKNIGDSLGGGRANLNSESTTDRTKWMLAEVAIDESIEYIEYIKDLRKALEMTMQCSVCNKLCGQSGYLTSKGYRGGYCDEDCLEEAKSRPDKYMKSKEYIEILEAEIQDLQQKLDGNATNSKLALRVKELEKSLDTVMEERDHYEDQVQSLDVYLGGSGEWSNAYCCFENAKELIDNKDHKITTLTSKLEGREKSLVEDWKEQCGEDYARGFMDGQIHADAEWINDWAKHLDYEDLQASNSKLALRVKELEEKEYKKYSDLHAQYKILGLTNSAITSKLEVVEHKLNEKTLEHSTLNNHAHKVGIELEQAEEEIERLNDLINLTESEKKS